MKYPVASVHAFMNLAVSSTDLTYTSTMYLLMRDVSSVEQLLAGRDGMKATEGNICWSHREVVGRT